MHDIVPCPSCGRRLWLRPEHLDKRVRCPACHTPFRPAEINRAEPPPAAPPEPSPEAEADAPGPALEETNVRDDEERPVRRRRRRRPDSEVRRSFRKRSNRPAAVALVGAVLGLIVLYTVVLLGLP